MIAIAYAATVNMHAAIIHAATTAIIHTAVIAIMHAATIAITHAVTAIMHAVIVDESFLPTNQSCGTSHDELHSLYLLRLCLHI